MGVFKNEVGRPTNEVKKKRLILKTLLTVIIAGGLFAGGYYVNDLIDKQNNNDTKPNENEKKPDNTQENSSNNASNSETKYKNVEFVRTTEVGGQNSYFIYSDKLENSESLNIKIINDTLTANVLDDFDNKKIIRQLKINGINSKVKYITMFDIFYFDIPIGPVAVLTEDNEVYVGEYNAKTDTFDFTLLVKNIVDMVLDIGSDPNEVTLYLLNDKDELKRVDSNRDTSSYELTNELYEERRIYLGNYHEGGISYLLSISVKDNKISFYDEEDYKKDFEEIFTPIKYNGTDIKIKYVMTTENGGTSSLYIITDENYILKTKKDRDGSSSPESCKECYELKKYNDSKVQRVEYEKDNDFRLNIKVTYEDGKVEEFKQMRFYDAEKNYFIN